jgi:hypothetical protein
MKIPSGNTLALQAGDIEFNPHWKKKKTHVKVI